MYVHVTFTTTFNSWRGTKTNYPRNLTWAPFCPPSIFTAEEAKLLTLDLKPVSDLSKTGFVMHFSLETREKNTTLGACLVYNHLRSSVSLCVFMASISVKMWSRMSFLGDAPAIIKIMIFHNNQSSYLTDKCNPSCSSWIDVVEKYSA